MAVHQITARQATNTPSDTRNERRRAMKHPTSRKEVACAPEVEGIILSDDTQQICSSEIDQSEEEMTVDTPSQASSTENVVSQKTASKQNALNPMDCCRSNGERSFVEQMNSLYRNERSCVEVLRQQWEVDNLPIATIMFLRFARFHKFNVRKARKGLIKFNKRYLTLTVAKVGPMLQAKVSSESTGNCALR